MALPPGPRLPSAAQTALWMLRPAPFLDRCMARWGDAFTLRFAGFPAPIVVVTHPDLVRQVCRADPEVMRNGNGNFPFAVLLGEKSLIILDGREHLRHRRLLLPAFSGNRLGRYADVFEHAANRSIDEWPVGRPFKLHPVMQQIALYITFRVVWAVRDDARNDRVNKLFRRLEREARSPRMMLALLRKTNRPDLPESFKATLQELDGLLYEQIRRAREDPDIEKREDILAVLLRARDEDGNAMTEVELRDELLTMLLAGHETTSTSLAWTFDYLLRDREVLERAREDAASGDGSYIRAVIAEVLRLRPSLPLSTRQLAEPFSVGGHELPAGTLVGLCTYLTNHRADTYPDPERFDPDRFVGSKPDTYAWLPFGGGVRRCLGAHFAQYEMEVIVRTILNRTRLCPTSPDHAPIRRQHITLVPKGGVEVTLEERLPLGGGPSVEATEEPVARVGPAR